MDSSSAVPTASVSRSESLLREVMTRFLRSRVEAVCLERDMDAEAEGGSSSLVSQVLALTESNLQPPVLRVATPKLYGCFGRFCRKTKSGSDGVLDV